MKIKNINNIYQYELSNVLQEKMESISTGFTCDVKEMFFVDLLNI